MNIFAAAGDLAPVFRAIVLTAGAVGWTLLLARLVGLRAFSKATAFDFAATIATGSLIAQAGTRSNWGDYAQAMAAIAAVFAVQYLLARGRIASTSFAETVDNTPLLLMEDGAFIDVAIRHARVTRATLMEKIRASGCARVSEVGAVVLETTGDITVMARGTFDPALLEGVRRMSSDGSV